MSWTRYRGYCGIGIYHGKSRDNHGSLLRSAHAFGADFVFCIGPRYPNRSSLDTTKAAYHLPTFRFESMDDLLAHRPRFARVVGIETDANRSLEDYGHPEQAIYLLGAEDHGLPPEVLERCDSVVSVPTGYCLNVAVTGAIVLYDRVAKAASRRLAVA